MDESALGWGLRVGPPVRADHGQEKSNSGRPPPGTFLWFVGQHLQGFVTGGPIRGVVEDPGLRPAGMSGGGLPPETWPRNDGPVHRVARRRITSEPGGGCFDHLVAGPHLGTRRTTHPIPAPRPPTFHHPRPQNDGWMERKEVIAELGKLPAVDRWRRLHILTNRGRSSAKPATTGVGPGGCRSPTSAFTKGYPGTSIRHPRQSGRGLLGHGDRQGSWWTRGPGGRSKAVPCRSRLFVGAEAVHRGCPAAYVTPSRSSEGLREEAFHRPAGVGPRQHRRQAPSNQTRGGLRRRVRARGPGLGKSRPSQQGENNGSVPARGGEQPKSCDHQPSETEEIPPAPPGQPGERPGAP